MEISNAYKTRVLTAMSEARNNYSGSDTAFAKTVGINGSVYSRIRKGEVEGLLSPSKWLSVGRILDVHLKDRNWVTARTDVFNKIERDLKNCKDNSLALIMVDECGIGKTYSARQIAKTLPNSFFVDCSQSKTKQQFIRLLARTVGVDSNGRYVDVKKELKYALTNIESPLIILDEAGDLEYTAFLELKELWNATEGECGWYMMGADGLKSKIDRGIKHKRVGYREIFDRFNNKYMQSVPNGQDAKKQYYAEMISEVLVANLPDGEHHQINGLVPRILGTDMDYLGCLRRTQTYVRLILDKPNNHE